MWSGMAGMCRIGGCSINSIGSGVLPGVEKTLDQQHRRQDGQPDADPDRVGPALRDQQAQGAEGHELPEADTTDAPDPAWPPAISTVARLTSRASQRKFSSAMEPPPPTPAAAGAPASHQAPADMAATVTPPVQVTRAARSAIIPILLVQCLDRPVEVHRRRHDAEAEPGQQEPRARPEPPVGEVARREPDRDTREQHRPEIDELSGLTPRRPPFFRSHVNRNTITRSRD